MAMDWQEKSRPDEPTFSLERGGETKGLKNLNKSLVSVHEWSVHENFL